ncbi:MAG: ATP-binding protein, partial [Limibacillus sp.]
SDLMSLSRIEMEEHRPPTECLRLDESLRSVVNGLEMKAAARKIALDCRFDLPMTVTGEEDEIAQVFQNLVDNAIKYGKEGSRVTIEASLQEEGTTRRGRRLERPMTVVSVSDQGEGIAREHIPRLTERFYRIDPARSRELGGTGLGLAIVKHLVNRHRGILEIESEVGQGSRFTVYLPQAQAASATQSPAESKASSAA